MKNKKIEPATFVGKRTNGQPVNEKGIVVGVCDGCSEPIKYQSGSLWFTKNACEAVGRKLNIFCLECAIPAMRDVAKHGGAVGGTTGAVASFMPRMEQYRKDAIEEN